MIIETDNDALKYLKEHVPDEGETTDVDIAPLKEFLFDVPDDLGPGEHLFEGPNGYKISFKLVVSNSFDWCWLDLKDTALEGDYRPIYAMLDLKVESPNFSYSLKYPDYEGRYVRPNIYWLPNLRLPDSELSGDYVNIGKKIVYLIGNKSGTLSRPIDLLGLFHEVGHLETDSELPFSPTHIMGLPLPRTPLSSAHELRREEYANEWLIGHTMPLFEDLGISPELVRDYCNQVQLRSYHDVIRRRVLNTAP